MLAAISPGYSMHARTCRLKTCLVQFVICRILGIDHVCCRAGGILHAV